MKIVRFLHKAYSLLFYKWVRYTFVLDSYFVEEPDMEWVMNKALFAISFIMLNWYLVFMTILEIILRKSIPYLFDDQLIYSIFIIVVISTFNYFILIYKKRWFKYDEEFAAYSKTKNRVISFSIFCFSILSVASYVVVVEIWANLGHAGKIEGF